MGDEGNHERRLRRYDGNRARMTEERGRDKDRTEARWVVLSLFTPSVPTISPPILGPCPSSLPLLGSLPFTLCLTPPHAPFTPLRSCPSSTPLHSVPSRRGEVTEERRNRAPKGRDEEWKDDTTGGSKRAG